MKCKEKKNIRIKSKIPLKKRVFVAVEGETDKAFMVFLQNIANDAERNIYFATKQIDGGGYRSMLSTTEKLKKDYDKQNKSKAKDYLLIVDSDRGINGDDGWTINTLKEKAKQKGITPCFLNPNLEGVIFKMDSRNKGKSPSKKHLKEPYKGYNKSTLTAGDLYQRFNFSNIHSLAKRDKDFRHLLEKTRIVDL